MTLQEIKTALRQGRFAWPGGYPLYFVSRQGEAFSFEGVKAEWCQVVQDYLWDRDTGWQIAGVDMNYEDADLYCAITGDRIEAAYGED